MFAKISEFILGGTRGFNEAEERLLSFLMDALPARDRRILVRQIQLVRKVQRQIPGRLVAAYYKSGVDVPRLPYPGDGHCLANITYVSDERPRTTSIVLHNGCLMTFERNVPRHLSEVEALVGLVLHPDGFESVAGDIDFQEHGEASGQSVGT